eukprot:338750_1
MLPNNIGVSNVQRRTWDKEAYERIAKDRLERGEESQLDEAKRIAALKEKANREEFLPADDKAEGPEGSKRAYLKARTRDLGLDSMAGKTVEVTTDEKGKVQGGYYCEVCECLLKDSLAWLDHINGKRHQVKLGYSMRVKKSSVGNIEKKLQTLKDTRDQEVRIAKGEGSGLVSSKVPKRPTAMEEHQQRITRAEEEEKQRKREMKEAKRKAKEEARTAATRAAKNDDLEAENPEVDVAMAAMMGFSGFGGSSK